MKNDRVLRRQVCLALVLAVQVSAQAPKPSGRDVLGWGKIKWGMTVTQAKAAYRDTAREPNGSEGSSNRYVERLVIDNFEVGDLRMTVGIYTSPNSDVVKEVTLSLPDGVSQAERAGAYTTLLDELTQKYGHPTKDDPRGSTVEGHSAKWLFPSTTIDLNWMETRGIDFGMLSLTYSASDKKARSVL